MLIILQASISFVNTLAIFDDDYYANVNNTFSGYEVSDLDTFSNQANEPGLLDYVEGIARLAWEMIWAVARILFGIVLIYPVIVDTFHLNDFPEVQALLAVVQIGIYIVYYMGWAQYKSGKSFEGFQ